MGAIRNECILKIIGLNLRMSDLKYRKKLDIWNDCTEINAHD